MNVLTLKFYDGSIIRYEYQPEGKGGKGIIAYDKSNATFILEQAAEEDNDNYYANMAKSKIETLVDKKNLPMECIQAWY